MNWWLVHKCIMEFDYHVAWCWTEKTGLDRNAKESEVNAFCKTNPDLCLAIWTQFLYNGAFTKKSESEEYNYYRSKISWLYDD